MRIAIMIDSLAIGGAQKHVRQLACGLAGEGHVVTVLVLNNIVEALYLEPLKAVGVEVRVIGKSGVLSGFGLLTSSWFLWRGGFDAVITVLFVSTLFGRFAAQLAGGIPILTCLQARNINYRWWQKLLVRATGPLTAHTVSNSRSALLWAAENEGVEMRHSSYIPNAVDPPKAAGQLPSWTELGLPQLEGKRVIGSLGRLDRQKGYDILIDALSRIPPGERSDLSVVVFGEGTDRCCLETLRDRCGLEDVLFLPGVHTNVEYILPKLWLYVQPSRFEGTPNAVMEALAAGLPVHASAVDGLIELPKSQNLRFVEQTPEAWASALQDIASKKLTRDHVVTCFLSPGQTSERYLDTLWKVLKSVEKWASGSDPRELYELAHAKSKSRPYSH